MFIDCCSKFWLIFRKYKHILIRFGIIEDNDVNATWQKPQTNILTSKVDALDRKREDHTLVIETAWIKQICWKMFLAEKHELYCS